MNIVEQKEAAIKEEMRQAVLKEGLAKEEELPEIILEKPKVKAHGDYASNIAMQMTRVAKQAPRKIAEQIVAHFDRDKASVERIEIAGPGFINFFMNYAYLPNLVKEILAAGDTYGES